MDLRILPDGTRKLRVTKTEQRKVADAVRIIRALATCGVEKATEMATGVEELLASVNGESHDES